MRMRPLRASQDSSSVRARLERKVALKVLDQRLTGDSQARARFIREARLVSVVDHPNICTVHEIGESDGDLFIAMKYVEGETLKRLSNPRRRVRYTTRAPFRSFN
jgi:serine/threonine protein kinase